MNMLLIELLICLFIAGLIGFIVGWLFSKVGYSNKILKIGKIKDNEISILKSRFEKEYSLLNQKLSNIEAENSSLKEKLKYEIEHNDSNVQDELDKLLKEKESLNTKFSNLSMKIDTLEKENRDLKVELDNCESQYLYKIESLKEENSNLSSEIERLKSSTQEVKISKFLETNEDKNLSQEDRMLIDKLKENELLIDELKTRVESLQEELAKREDFYENKIEGLLDKDTKEEREIENLQKELEDANEHIVYLEQNIRDYQSEIDKLKELQKEKSEELESLKATLNRDRESEDALENKLKEIESKFELKEKELVAKNSEIQKKLDELISEKEDRKKLIDKITHEREELKKRVKELQNDREEVVKELKVLKESFENLENGKKDSLKGAGSLDNSLNALLIEGSSKDVKDNNMIGNFEQNREEDKEQFLIDENSKDLNSLEQKDSSKVEVKIGNKIAKEVLDDTIDNKNDTIEQEDLDYSKYETDNIEINPLKDKLIGLKSSLNENIDEKKSEDIIDNNNNSQKEVGESVEIKRFDRVNKHKAKGMKRVIKVRRGLVRKNILKKDTKKS